MNILIIGNGEIEKTLIKLCQKSKHLAKLYVASNESLEDIPNIEYSSFEELVKKAKALQIDIILYKEKELIKNGLTEFLKSHMLNVISVNKKWFNLENSRLAAKQLLEYYNINTPKAIMAPSTFPVVIKTNQPYTLKIINSMSELVKETEQIAGKVFYLEEYLDGKIINLLSLWDGKNIIHFNNDDKLTEAQQDRLDLLKTKFQFMFSDEKPDFIGFFTSKLIWAKNDWFVTDFIMNIHDDFNINTIKTDFLYLLNSAIYQKLNEI